MCRRYQYTTHDSIAGVQPGTTAYLPLQDLGSNKVLLPPTDNGLSSAIPLPTFGFPFWSTNRSRVYVIVIYDINLIVYINPLL